jgi:hypothetical protein
MSAPHPMLMTMPFGPNASMTSQLKMLRVSSERLHAKMRI